MPEQNSSARPGRGVGTVLQKLVYLVPAVVLFILSLESLTLGAKPLGPLIRGAFSVDSPANSLGFGWLFATLVFSGSPVAATAVAFHDAQVLTTQEAYAMIVGSRLGASFFVLVLGVVYVIRGHKPEQSLSSGILSQFVTQSVYLPALLVGSLALSRGWTSGWSIRPAATGSSLLDIVFSPFSQALSTYVPGWALFPLAFVSLLLCFALFDRSLPQLKLREENLGAPSRLVFRPIVSFFLGGAITLVSFSVRVSLSLLVPLSARGYIRQENAIPYIMGANVTTLIDTLFAAVLLGHPEGPSMVLTLMLSVGLTSLLILVAGFRGYERLLVRLTNWTVSRRRNLAVYVLLMFVAIIGLMLV